ncbi:MAG: hypothetical protein AAFP19_02630 [Bacteroidota bacterium]
MKNYYLYYSLLFYFWIPIFSTMAQPEIVWDDWRREKVRGDDFNYALLQLNDGRVASTGKVTLSGKNENALLTISEYHYQKKSWETTTVKNYGKKDFDEVGQAIGQTPDDALFIAGYQRHRKEKTIRHWLIEVDGLGRKIREIDCSPWMKNPKAPSRFEAMKVRADGELLIAGQAGDSIWIFTYQAKTNTGKSFYKALPKTDETYHISGLSIALGKPVVCIVSNTPKLSKQRSYIWDLARRESQDWLDLKTTIKGTCALRYHQGHYWLVGHSSNRKELRLLKIKADSTNREKIIKIEEKGKNKATFPKDRAFYPADMIITPEGDFIICGKMQNPLQNFSAPFVCAIQVDEKKSRYPIVNILWQQSEKLETKRNDQLLVCELLGDGHLMLAGASYDLGFDRRLLALREGGLVKINQDRPVKLAIEKLRLKVNTLDTLHARSAGYIECLIRNEDRYPVYGLVAKVHFDGGRIPGLKGGYGRVLPALAAGESKWLRFNLQGQADLHSDRRDFRILVENRAGEPLQSSDGQLRLVTKAAPKPLIRITQGLFNAGEERPAERGDSIQLIVDIRNFGEATAFDVHTVFRLPDLVDALGPYSQHTDSIPPGQSIRDTFYFYPRSMYHYRFVLVGCAAYERYQRRSMDFQHFELDVGSYFQFETSGKGPFYPELPSELLDYFDGPRADAYDFVNQSPRLVHWAYGQKDMKELRSSDGLRVNKFTLYLKAQARDLGNIRSKEVQLFVDDKKYDWTKEEKAELYIARREGYLILPINLKKGKNQIYITVKGNASETITIDFDAPIMYSLNIGVHSSDLKHTANSAQAMNKLFRIEGLGEWYKAVRSLGIYTSESQTQTATLQGLINDLLDGEVNGIRIANNAHISISFSGHGELVRNGMDWDYYLMGANLSNDIAIRSTMPTADNPNDYGILLKGNLLRFLNTYFERSFVYLGTCYSGNFGQTIEDQFYSIPSAIEQQPLGPSQEYADRYPHRLVVFASSPLGEKSGSKQACGRNFISQVAVEAFSGHQARVVDCSRKGTYNTAAGEDNLLTIAEFFDFLGKRFRVLDRQYRPYYFPYRPKHFQKMHLPLYRINDCNDKNNDVLDCMCY